MGFSGSVPRFRYVSRVSFCENELLFQSCAPWSPVTAATPTMTHLARVGFDQREVDREQNFCHPSERTIGHPRFGGLLRVLMRAPRYRTSGVFTESLEIKLHN